MTNFASETATVNQSALLKCEQRLPLIPPASIRKTHARASNSKQSTANGRESERARGDNFLRQQFTAHNEEQAKMLTQARRTSAPISSGRQPLPPLPPSSHTNNNTNIKRNNDRNNPSLSSEVWSSVDDLFWDHMKEVQNKWNTLKLNDDIWAKLIYFEQNRRLAKAYVSAPVLTIDGSTNGLDGFRIGLSGIDNTYRSLHSMACLRSIGQGIRLKIDSQGNILIRRVAPTLQQQQQQHRHCSVWIQDWPSASYNQDDETLLPDESTGCLMREVDSSETSQKLFDMRKFRLKLEQRQLNNETFMDWRQCVSIISFVCRTPGSSGSTSSSSSSGSSSSGGATLTTNKQTTKRTINTTSATASGAPYKGPKHELLENPCWLMIINIIAIDMLKSSNCDNRNYQQLGPSKLGPLGLSSSSSLVRNHALLGSATISPTTKATQLSSNDNIGYHRANGGVVLPNSIRQQNRAPLSPRDTNGPVGQMRASSSTSNLFQSSSSSLFAANNRVLSGAESASTAMPLGASSNERIKKLRTANNRHRPLPLKHQASQYRRYQSSQQLSLLSTTSTGNNTIYTTFNSKFMNASRQQQQQQPADSLASTSDYNSTSRSTSSGAHYYSAWRESRNKLLAPFPLCNPIFDQEEQEQEHYKSSSSSQYKAENKQTRLENQKSGVFVSRSMMLNSSGLEANGKSRSLSNFESLHLQQQRRRQKQQQLDLRAMQSSIKMNFDYMNEVEDNKFEGQSAATSEQHYEERENFFEDDKAEIDYEADTPDEAQFQVRANSKAYSGSPPKGNLKSLSTRDSDQTSSQPMKSRMNRAQKDDQTFNADSRVTISRHSKQFVDHHACQAMQGYLHPTTMALVEASERNGDTKTMKTTTTTKNGQTQEERLEQQQQKPVSRSSIASSSSSSGCVDNDYFMSHSSSSMSSSSTSNSNERDLFSQPASSSGIVCSGGNTSDEYDNVGNKRKSAASTNAHLTTSPDPESLSVKGDESVECDHVACSNPDEAKSEEMKKKLIVDGETFIKTGDDETIAGETLHDDETNREERNQKGVTTRKVINSSGSNVVGNKQSNSFEHQKRGFKIKAVELPTDYRALDLLQCDCDQTNAENATRLAANNLPFDDGCDCCTCDCFSADETLPQFASTTKTKKLASPRKRGDRISVASSPIGCDCDEHSIYMQLPHPNSMRERAKGKPTDSKSGSSKPLNKQMSGSSGQLQSRHRSSSLARLRTQTQTQPKASPSVNRDDQQVDANTCLRNGTSQEDALQTRLADNRPSFRLNESHKLAPNCDQSNKRQTSFDESKMIQQTVSAVYAKEHTKQQASSWLERRRYSKMLPKFIFASSSSNTANQKQAKSNDINGATGGTQRKSNTMDRNDKTRLSRSTQNFFL